MVEDGVPIVAQWLMNLTSTRMQVQFLVLLSGLRIQHYHELWCRLQTWLRSCLAVAVANSTAPIKPPAWESPYDMAAALKSKKKKKKPNKQKKQKKENNNNKKQWQEYTSCLYYWSSFGVIVMNKQGKHQDN